MTQKESLVAVIMGSISDADIVRGCTDMLTEFDIPYDVKVLSAHRTPDLTREYVLSLNNSKTEVIIAAAGWAAHLAGFIAGMTVLPVIGIPVDSSPLNGMDALLSTVQMPPGIPVATVAVGSGGAKNAAVLALEILALNRPALKDQLLSYRKKLAEKIEAQNLMNL
ncbi:MAG: 5-(carboxyamino)imidazole ribonucleotide mutase [Desulfobacteraceae bacterium 4484_190.1]|nr:MAG: 5-(carboxyamino)imidazole ribonucleotide mutase [Desulfobacteraceae bacterium 4484_190.1]